MLNPSQNLSSHKNKRRYAIVPSVFYPSKLPYATPKYKRTTSIFSFSFFSLVGWGGTTSLPWNFIWCLIYNSSINFSDTRRIRFWQFLSLVNESFTKWGIASQTLCLQYSFSKIYLSFLPAQPPQFFHNSCMVNKLINHHLICTSLMARREELPITSQSNYQHINFKLCPVYKLQATSEL